MLYVVCNKYVYQPILLFCGIMILFVCCCCRGSFLASRFAMKIGDLPVGVGKIIRVNSHRLHCCLHVVENADDSYLPGEIIICAIMQAVYTRMAMC